MLLQSPRVLFCYLQYGRCFQYRLRWRTKRGGKVSRTNGAFDRTSSGIVMMRDARSTSQPGTRCALCGVVPIAAITRFPREVAFARSSMTATYRRRPRPPAKASSWLMQTQCLYCISSASRPFRYGRLWSGTCSVRGRGSKSLRLARGATLPTSLGLLDGGGRSSWGRCEAERAA